MLKKICAWCGAEFETNNGKQIYCKQTHYDKCIICGKEFAIKNEYLSAKERPQTCSKECRSQLRKRSCVEKYGGIAPATSLEVQAKMRATNQKRYGVTAPMQSKDVQEKAKKTCLERYGAEYFGQTDEGRQQLSDRYKDVNYTEKVKQAVSVTNMKKYGVKSVFSLQEVRDKCKLTYKAKSGYEYAYQNPEIHEKLKAGSLKKFGTAYATQSSKGREQIRNTFLRKHGVKNTLCKGQLREKVRQTLLFKYGVDNYAKTDQFKHRFIEKMLAEYGVANYSQTDEFKLRMMKNPSKFDDFKQFDTDPVAYIDSHYSAKPSLLELANDLGVGTEAVTLRVTRANCKDKIAYVKSTMEREVIAFIKSLGDDIVIEENTHKVITPKEIDIYLPDYKFGIECNPASTHNSTVDTWDPCKPPMSPNYHKLKTDDCEKKSIFLFHIFGYEWVHNREVIQSMLRNILGRNLNKIYARKCSIKEVDSASCRRFLNENHRQGFANSHTRIGLFYNDELVSIMTFGKMRETIGTGSDDLSDCYELVRFCSKLNTTVVGGADRLFKYFIKQYNPKRIRSFSDRAHTRGTLYSTLGFKEIRRSDPGYVWVNIYNDKPYHRVNAQKSHIKEFLKDDSIDLSKTERQIMIEHGFVQVYDSGTITWEWNEKQQN